MDTGVRFLYRASELRWDALPTEQDIRGYSVLDDTGAPLGRIIDLYLDPETAAVRAAVVGCDEEPEKRSVFLFREISVISGGHVIVPRRVASADCS